MGKFRPQRSVGCPGQLCPASRCGCTAAGRGASAGEQSGQVLFKLALPHGQRSELFNLKAHGKKFRGMFYCEFIYVNATTEEER